MLKSVKFDIKKEGLEVSLKCGGFLEMARLRSCIEERCKEELLYIEFESYHNMEYQSKEFDIIKIEEEQEFLKEVKEDIKRVIENAIDDMEICGYWE